MAMNQLLPLKKTLHLHDGQSCHLVDFLGGGGQGEVYRATLAGQTVALKWYFPQQATATQWEALTLLIQKGAPNDRFLWPFSLAQAQGIQGFGYFMPLRDKRYKSLFDLMTRRVEPTFYALINAGMELAHSFLQLHAEGLCYRDISFGNVFFDPDNGKILICDNDNVTVHGEGSALVLGTPRFMAPEIVRGESTPNIQTDLFSLAILLFYLFMGHHPLEGRRESLIKCMDIPAMNKLYGYDPLFIFDPHHEDNRPVPGYQDNALIFWDIYPQFIRALFIQAFTFGINHLDKRVRESEWRLKLAELRDTRLYCEHCSAEVFYDVQALKAQGQLNPCWSCQKTPTPPPRIRIDRQIVMLNRDTQLFAHHVDPHATYDFSQPLATVNRHPKRPQQWGLKNLSSEKWVITTASGTMKDILPGQSLTLANETKINFGKIVGEIRV